MFANFQTCTRTLHLNYQTAINTHKTQSERAHHKHTCVDDVDGSADDVGADLDDGGNGGIVVADASDSDLAED